jgi:NitT/TauT family transport system permease protein
VGVNRDVMLTATPPSFVGGVEQGWASVWRSLLAGEMIVIIVNEPSIGRPMQQARRLPNCSDIAPEWCRVRIGLLNHAVTFGTLDRAIRRRSAMLAD